MGLNNNLGRLTEVLTVSGSNVGIGKTVPTSKLDISGSTLITGSLEVSSGITGSLFGTASYATTASYLEGYISPFPYTGSALITGSLEVTGSVSSTGGFTGSLLGTASTASFVDVAGLGGFVQGGNSFGTQALIGTNDNQSLALETSGSTRMFISSSGNVGIGLTTPGEKLDVIGHIRSKYAANGSNIALRPDFAQVYIVASSADNTSGDKKLVLNSTGLSLRALGSSTAAMEILSNGYVGIGNTNPDAIFTITKTNTDYTNASSGHILLDNSSSIGQSSIYYRINGTVRGKLRVDQVGTMNHVANGGNHEFWTGGDAGVGSVKMFISSSGNVGIGTSTPAGGIGTTSTGTILDIYDGTAIGNNGGALILSALGNSSRKLNLGQIRTILTDGTTSSEKGDMTFSTMNAATLSERVRITSGGNVQIGKNYSNAKLDITGNTLVTGSLLMVSTGSNSNVLDLQGTSGPLFNITDSLSGDIFSVSDISGLPILNINSNGNVDIDGEVRIAGRNLILSYGGTYETRIQANNQINSYYNSGGTGMYLNFQGNGPVYAGSSYAVLYAGSDRRIKTDIEDVEPTLDKILNLTPRTFKYKERPEYTSYGFIAQEVEEVMPEIVKTEQGVSHCNGEEVINQKSVESYGLAWASILVKGMQEQQELINTLTAKIDLLEQKLK